MITIDREICDECATCVAVCPSGALRFGEALVVDNDTCTACGNCVAVCPFGALALIQQTATES
jgi:ferredoxin